MSEPECPNPTSVEGENLRATGSHDHGPSADAQSSGAIRLRLLASVIALAAGAAALIVAIELLRTVLG